MEIRHYYPEELDILALYYRKGVSVFRSDRSFYKKLREQSPELSCYTDQQICSLLDGFNKHLVDVAVDNRDGIQLPAHMGHIMVCTMGKRTRAVDRKRTKELGMIVYHRNEHSDGQGAGIYYTAYHAKENNSNPKKMYVNCEFFSFFGNRRFVALMSQAYRTNWKKYWMIPKSRRVIDMIDTYQKQLKTKKVIKSISQDYDEFKF